MYSSMGLGMSLYVASIIFFDFPHVLHVSASSICIVSALSICTVSALSFCIVSALVVVLSRVCGVCTSMVYSNL